MTFKERNILLLEYRKLVSAAIYYDLKGNKEESFYLSLQHQAVREVLKAVGIKVEHIIDTYELAAKQAKENHEKWTSKPLH